MIRYPSGSSGSSGGNGSSAAGGGGGGGGGRSETSSRCNDDSSYGGGGGGGGASGRGVDCRVVEGKLFYEKRWYRRGQSIVVEPRQGDKYPAMISAIGECVGIGERLSSYNQIRLKRFCSFVHQKKNH